MGESLSSELLRACEKNDLEKVKEVIGKPKVNVNWIDYPLIFNKQKSPFMTACKNGNPDIVKLFLEHPKLEVNKKDKIVRKTGLEYACSEGHIEVVKLLLAHHGIDVNETPLFQACKEGNTEIVKLLLEQKGIDLVKNDPLKNSKTGEIRQFVQKKVEETRRISSGRILTGSKSIPPNQVSSVPKPPSNTIPLNTVLSHRPPAQIVTNNTTTVFNRPLKPHQPVIVNHYQPMMSTVPSPGLPSPHMGYPLTNPPSPTIMTYGGGQPGHQNRGYMTLVLTPLFPKIEVFSKPVRMQLHPNHTLWNLKEFVSRMFHKSLAGKPSLQALCTPHRIRILMVVGGPTMGGGPKQIKAFGKHRTSSQPAILSPTDLEKNARLNRTRLCELKILSNAQLYGEFYEGNYSRLYYKVYVRHFCFEVYFNPMGSTTPSQKLMIKRDQTLKKLKDAISERIKMKQEDFVMLNNKQPRIQLDSETMKSKTLESSQNWMLIKENKMMVYILQPKGKKKTKPEEQKEEQKDNNNNNSESEKKNLNAKLTIQEEEEEESEEEEEPISFGGAEEVLEVEDEIDDDPPPPLPPSEEKEEEPKEKEEEEIRKKREYEEYIESLRKKEEEKKKRIEAEKGRLHAFVVGQNHSGLQFAYSDALKMSKKLKEMGYEVCELVYREDCKKLTYSNFRKQFVRFCKKLEKEDKVVVYFSGHGFQDEGENYLQCCKDEEEIEDMNLGFLVQTLRKKDTVNFFFLDCCQNDNSNITWKGDGDGGGGFTPISNICVQGGQFVFGFACLPGTRTVEKGGGIFTSSLMKFLSKDEEISRILMKANRDMFQTEGRQGMVTSTALDDLYL